MAEEDVFMEAQKLASMFSHEKDAPDLTADSKNETTAATGILIDLGESPPPSSEEAVPTSSNKPETPPAKTKPKKSVDEIEQHRMDPEHCEEYELLPSPTLPELSSDSDGFLTNEKFDFDIAVSPAPVNTTFTKSPTGEDEDEDEVFFGPVGFTEVVVRKAVEKQVLESKPLSPLTEAEMMEVMAESMRLVERIQEAKDTKPQLLEVVTSTCQKPVMTLSQIIDKSKSGSPINVTSLMPVNSRTVTKSPGCLSVPKETLQDCQVRLFSPSGSPCNLEVTSASTPVSESMTSKESTAKKKMGLKVPNVRSGLKPPGSNKGKPSDPNLPKRKKLDMNQSTTSDDLHTSLNSSNSSDIPEDAPPQKRRSLRLPTQVGAKTGPGLNASSTGNNLSVDNGSRHQRKRSLQPPGTIAGGKKQDLNRSTEKLHISLNSSTSSEQSSEATEDGKIPVSSQRKRSLQPPKVHTSKSDTDSSEKLQTSLNSSTSSEATEESVPPQKKRSLQPPSKISALPSALQQPASSKVPKPGQKSMLLRPSITVNKPAIKSSLTKLDSLKPSLGVGTSRLVRPGLAMIRPSGPMKAVQPTSAIMPPTQVRKPTTATSPTGASTEVNRRRSTASPGGCSTPKRSGICRSKSFNSQNTPTRLSSASSCGTGTPGSAGRRSLLPQRHRSTSISSSLGSVSSIPDSPCVLLDINNITDASPSCFKAKTARVHHTPLNKENAAQSKVSRWSPVPRPKPISGDEYFVCTKKTT